MSREVIEVRMLMLGVSLVRAHKEAAEIVAEGLAEIQRLRDRVRRLESAQSRKVRLKAKA
jgi:hypothetical protein